jgi:hypothetical protein
MLCSRLSSESSTALLACYRTLCITENFWIFDTHYKWNINIPAVVLYPIITSRLTEAPLGATGEY